jgi:dihydrofolate synthase/folylpolyglutamate synthase
MALTIFLKASEILKFPVNTEKILEALKNTSWEGRLEVIRKKTLLILDGAHNISALKETLENLQTLEKFPLVIFGAMKDKEWKEFLKLIRKYTSRIYIVEIKYHRSEKAENMEEYAKKLNFKEIKTFKDIDQLLKAIEKEEAIILGSLYLIGEVKKRIKKET